MVRGVDSVDVANRQIYFRASGMNAKQDPYFIHYYRINFDGTGLVAYTEADGYAHHHLVAGSQVLHRHVLARRHAARGRAEARERSQARSRSRRVTCPRRSKAGFRPPEVFVAKARDGKTDIWGIIVRPVTFDAKKKYPVIEQIYAGPHGIVRAEDLGRRPEPDVARGNRLRDRADRWHGHEQPLEGIPRCCVEEHC